MLSLVSCIYNIGYRSADYYAGCFLRLAQNNPDIKFFLYTDQVGKINPFPSNVSVISRKITELGKHDFVEKNRGLLTDGQNSNRIGMDGYLNLNHSRVDLINEIDDDYIFSIDAALFSEDLFLNKHINKKLDIDRITSKDFIFMSKKHSHASLHGLDTDQLFSLNLLKPDYNMVIGGFFGGKKKYVKELKTKYEHYLAKYTQNNLFSVDECILSSINSVSNFKNVVHEVHFEQWYNEETRLYPQDTSSPMEVGKSTFSDIFNKNFQI